MADNFLNSVPVGTKIFNKENRRYYVKVNVAEGDSRYQRAIWKEARGSFITSPFRDLTIDKKGNTFQYKGKTIETGDNIPDYLQKDSWTGRSLIQIKNSKYYNPAGKEYTGLKIGERKGEVYTIEGFESPTGLLLKDSLNEGVAYNKYLDDNLRRRLLETKISDIKQLKKEGKNFIADRLGNLTDLETQLKALGPATPFKSEIQPNNKSKNSYNEFNLGDPKASVQNNQITKNNNNNKAIVTTPIESKNETRKQLLIRSLNPKYKYPAQFESLKVGN